MRNSFALATVVALALGVAGVGFAQDGHEMPKPQKEHEWLQQLVGEWDTEGEFPGEPGKPPVKNKGTESARMIGGFWVHSEHKGEAMGAPFTGLLTVGYDPEKKKYVGTWVDSMSTYLWRYEGTVDASGKKLTLETEGPAHDGSGKTAKYREAIEVNDKDHKTFTSSAEKDGKWITFMTIQYTRKK